MLNQYYANKHFRYAIEHNEGSIEDIQYLLNSGANIELNFECNRTALHKMADSFYFTKLLVENGANIEAKTDDN